MMHGQQNINNVENYGRDKQATDDNIMVHSKYGTCVLDDYGKNTDTLISCNFILLLQLLLSHSKNSYAKAHQYHIIIMLPFMFRAF
jgi:hypothetical protein